MKLSTFLLPWRSLPTAFLGSIALFACAGTDTGNPVDGDGSSLNDDAIELPQEHTGPCDEQESELDWDEAPFGFSAADVETTLDQGVTEGIRWHGVSELDPPDAEDSTITIRIMPRAPVLSVTPVPVGGNDGPVSEGPGQEGPAADGPVTGNHAADDLPSLIGPTCGSKLRMEAFVEVTTADGALDERFVTTIDALGPEAARAHVRIPWDALRGSLESRGRFDELEVAFLLTPVGIKGTLRVIDDASEEAPVLATLAGNDECRGTDAGFSLEGEESLQGLSPTGLKELFGQVNGADWTLEHEEGTLSVSSELTLGDALCVSAHVGMVEFLSTVHLEADGGSLSGSFPVNVYVHSDSKAGVLAAQMAGGKYVQDVGEAETLGEDYGLTSPAPLDGYDGAMTDFIVDVTAQPWGIFRYAGLTQAPCLTPEDGCEGLVPTTLFGMHLGDPKNGYELE